MPSCEISNKYFEISEQEKALRKKLNASEPTCLPKYTLQKLSAFWPHFGIHNRKCDATNENIIAIYDENCPYPVWKRSYWVENASPPSSEYDFSKPFFDQLWELFQKSPIPHNIGLENLNCDYTDDWWHSKNCYLSHSGFQCEDLRYSYRNVRIKDSMSCVFSFDSELCFEIIYCMNLYKVVYAINSRNSENSFFLFDCRNCSDCMFCYNLRNKKYCINNVQYSKEEYLIEKEKLQLSSRKVYDQMKKDFQNTIKTKAWWKAQDIEQCINCNGNFLENCKDSENCYLASEFENCINCVRGIQVKDSLDCVSVCFHSEKVYLSSTPQERCYEVRCCFNIVNCKFMEYCSNCLNCENCFGCSGLVSKKYYILNKQYSKEEYYILLEKIKNHLKNEGVYNKFFPGYFAPNPYDESHASTFMPLTREEQEKRGFRVKIQTETKNDNYISSNDIYDDSLDADESICEKIFWDDKSQHRFKITKEDLKFCQKHKIPLPNTFYIRTIKENMPWMFFDVSLRKTTCAKTGKQTKTTLPSFLDGRILSEETYLGTVY